MTRRPEARPISYRKILGRLALLSAMVRLSYTQLLLTPLVIGQVETFRRDRADRLRNAVARQMRSADRLRTLPKSVESRGGTPRMLQWAGEYLERSAHRFDRDAFVEFILGRSATGLTADEGWQAVRILELACLHEVYHCLVARIAAGSTETDPSLVRLMACLTELDETDAGALARALGACEDLLEADPGGIYPSLSDRAKYSCRLQAERLARRENIPVRDIVARSNDQARTSLNSVAGTRGTHNGARLFAVCPETCAKPPAIAEALQAANPLGRHVGSPLRYLVGGGALAGLTAILLLQATRSSQLSPLEFSLLSIILAAIVYEALDVSARRAALGRLALPPEFSMSLDWLSRQTVKAVIAVPMVIGDPERGLALIDRLLADARSLEGGLFVIAILSDFPDSRAPDIAVAEAENLRSLVRRLETASTRETWPTASAPIVLLHRDRTFAPDQNLWIGSGRKAGKLRELNRLLVEGSSELDVVWGTSSVLSGASHVIVLDEDTELAPQAMRTLFASALHPLARPSLAVDGLEVTDGFGVIAPGLSIPVSNAATLSVRTLSSPARGFPDRDGLGDPLFDVWGFRQFSGKGIYDVHAAHSLLNHVTDARTILSHDVVEGAYLRTGFARGTVLYDIEASSDFAAALARRERWVRGDIQNLLALVGIGSMRLERLPSFGKYLILENARRAVFPVAQFAACLVIAARPDGVPLSLSLALLLWPMALELLHALWRAALDVRSGIIWYDIGGRLRWLIDGVLLELVRLVVLPQIAITTLWAVTRAIGRSASRRNLLQWTPSSAVSTDTKSRYRVVSAALCVTSLMLLAASVLSGHALAATLFAAWTLAPLFTERRVPARPGAHA